MVRLKLTQSPSDLLAPDFVLFYFPRPNIQKASGLQLSFCRMRSFFISTLLLVCVLSTGFAVAQIQPSGFHIAIVDGEGALNNVKGRLAREPIVQVEDENHKRLVGAYVTFDTPTSGPSGVFADGSTHFVTTTDADGRAVAHGLRPNNINGKFEIHVHVTYNGQPVGDLTIHQANVSGETAALSKNLENGAVAATIAAGVLGLVEGREFLVNGSNLQGNANLSSGAHLQTLGTTVKLYVHDGGEFLVAPHSAVTVAPDEVDLNSGVLRAQQFGKCKVRYGDLIIVAAAATADAVLALTAGGLQVASVDGPVQVLSADGSVLDTVQPGLVSAFGNIPAGSSGASAAAGARVSRIRTAYPYIVLGATLAGLGVAVDTIAASPAPTSP